MNVHLWLLYMISVMLLLHIENIEKCPPVLSRRTFCVLMDNVNVIHRCLGSWLLILILTPNFQGLFPL